MVSSALQLVNAFELHQVLSERQKDLELRDSIVTDHFGRPFGTFEFAIRVPPCVKSRIIVISFTERLRLTVSAHRPRAVIRLRL